MPARVGIRRLPRTRGVEWGIARTKRVAAPPDRVDRAFEVVHLDAVGAARENAPGERLVLAQAFLRWICLGDVVSLGVEAGDLARVVTNGLVDERDEPLFRHPRRPLQPDRRVIGEAAFPRRMDLIERCEEALAPKVRQDAAGRDPDDPPGCP